MPRRTPNTDFKLYFLFREGFNSAERHKFSFIDGLCGPMPYDQARLGVSLTGARMIEGPSQKQMNEFFGHMVEGYAPPKAPEAPESPESPEAPEIEEVPEAEEVPEVEEDEEDEESPEGEAEEVPSGYVPVEASSADPDDVDWGELQRVTNAVRDAWDWADGYGASPNKESRQAIFREALDRGLIAAA